MLSAKIRAKSRYKANTTLEFWKELKEDDVLIITENLQDLYYAPETKVFNTRTGKDYINSRNMMVKYLKSFDYVQEQT